MDKEKIDDLVQMTKIEGTDIGLLMQDSYRRGFVDGKDFAKQKAIEAINQEK